MLAGLFFYTAHFFNREKQSITICNPKSVQLIKYINCISLRSYSNTKKECLSGSVTQAALNRRSLLDSIAIQQKMMEGVRMSAV